MRVKYDKWLVHIGKAKNLTILSILSKKAEVLTLSRPRRYFVRGLSILCRQCNNTRKYLSDSEIMTTFVVVIIV
jgi:hypothetical protein